MTFGEYIREKRQKKKLSITQFAKQVRVSQVLISRVEANQVKPPSEETIIRIASVLEENPDELILLANKFPSQIKDSFRQNKRFLPLFRSLESLDSDSLQKIYEHAQALNLERFKNSE